MIEMTEVNPHPTETYSVGVDDHCLVVSSGDADAPKVWLSGSMLKWLGSQGSDRLRQEYAAAEDGADTSVSALRLETIALIRKVFNRVEHREPVPSCVVEMVTTLFPYCTL